METQYLPTRSTMETILKYWPIITVILTCLATVSWQSISWALDVDDKQDATTTEVLRMKGEVKQISDVQVDINKLNVSNAKLQSEVKHINESIQRTELMQRDTNALLREVIKKQSERPEPVERLPRYEPREYYNRRPQW